MDRSTYEALKLAYAALIDQDEGDMLAARRAVAGVLQTTHVVTDHRAQRAPLPAWLTYQLPGVRP